MIFSYLFAKKFSRKIFLGDSFLKTVLEEGLEYKHTGWKISKNKLGYIMLVQQVKHFINAGSFNCICKYQY